METKILPAGDKAIAEAVEILRRGGLVAFPTDTVYGVGAHAFLAEAVERIYMAKERPGEKAIPLLLSDASEMERVAESVPPEAWLLARRFWPGGLSLVVPKSRIVPEAVSPGPTVAVRVPNHPVALKLIEALGAPLAATSANISGHPSPVTAAEVLAELGGRIQFIIDGGACPGGIPSTVLDLTVTPPRILRPGPVSREEIEATIGRKVEIAR